MVGSIRNSTRWLRHTLLLVLALMLGMNGAGMIVPAHAAGPAQGRKATLKITIVVDVIPPKDPVCVGKPADIKVNTRGDLDVIFKSGSPPQDHLNDWTQDAVNVMGKITKGPLATLFPNQLLTGSYASGQPGQGVFKFTGNKAGDYELTFNGAYEGYDSPPTKITIKVVNCNYKVDMHVTDIDSGGGVSIIINGDMETKITGDSGELTGKGTFTIISGFTGPPCSISYSETENPTTVTGKFDNNDQLVLDFQYQPGQITSSVSCPDGGGGSTTHIVDLTNTGIASATFPEEGGSRSIPFTYAGSDFAPGRMEIDVEPVPEQAGG